MRHALARAVLGLMAACALAFAAAAPALADDGGQTVIDMVHKLI